MTQCGAYEDWRCCQKLFQSTIYIYRMLWSTQAALDGSPYVIQYHFLYWCGTLNWLFWLKFKGVWGDKWHSVDHTGIRYSIQSSFNTPYKSKEWQGILKLQWMPLLITDNTISCTDMVRNICYFGWNLRVFWGMNDTVLGIWGWDMMSEALLVYPIQLLNDMEYSSSNICLSLVVWHTIPFLLLIWCPSFVILILELLGVCCGA